MMQRAVSKGLRGLALIAPLALLGQPARALAPKTPLGDLPVCARPLGAMAVAEPPSRWWTARALDSPAELIKGFVHASHCFTLIDRREDATARTGERRKRAADFVLTPDLIARGLHAREVDREEQRADVSLSITDLRSSEQVAWVKGHATRADLEDAGSVLAADVGKGYDLSEAGKVMALAYLRAYAQLVKQLGGLSGTPASNEPPEVSLSKPGRLFANADGSGAVVRPLEAGTMLYPTGNKQGGMWEVNDELGNKGWVSSLLFNLAR